MREGIKKQIEVECKNICQNKLALMNMILERKGNDKRKYELVMEKTSFLGVLNNSIQELMSILLEDPKIVATIIQNSGIKELKKQIAPFFVNNFYENILSNYSIENNLIYVFTLLIKEEINSLNNINQIEDFLHNTPCGVLLHELKDKSDIKAFFKIIILNEVENLEFKHSLNKLKIRIEDTDVCEEIKFPKNKEINIKDSINIFEKKKSQELQENFNLKYLPDLDQATIKKLIANENYQSINDYLNPKLKECLKEYDIFSNTKFLWNLFNTSSSEKVLEIYQNNFYIIISFIDSIIDKIIDNLYLLPYSVKCLYKIISLLINKKFPKINDIQRNAFIARFFFGKLLFPILLNPGNEVFINKFIITRNTLNNLSLICKIIAKFISGKFFTSSEENGFYTPFNWFFIDKIEKLENIFNKITKVDLPPFIEKIIKEELPEDYEYNYFKENPDEVINYNCICFNLEQIKAIITSVQNCQRIFFNKQKHLELKKNIEKLLSQNFLKLSNDLLNKDKKANSVPNNLKKSRKKKDIIKEESEDPKIYYFLLTKLFINEKYSKLFNIEKKPQYYSLEDLSHNDILKVKNLFCLLLNNYINLVKTDFDEGKTKSIEIILKEINKYIKSSNFIRDDLFPMELFIKSLFEYLPKIPEYLSVNDYEKIYNEIEIDLKKRYKELDFELLGIIMEKLKNARRTKAILKENQSFLKDIKLKKKQY